MIIRSCLLIVMVIIFLITMTVLFFHPGNCLQQLQSIKLMIIVSVMFSKILHQKFCVIQGVDINVFFLHLGFDVLSLLFQIDIDIFVSWFIRFSVMLLVLLLEILIILVLWSPLSLDRLPLLLLVLLL